MADPQALARSPTPTAPLTQNGSKDDIVTFDSYGQLGWRTQLILVHISMMKHAQLLFTRLHVWGVLAHAPGTLHLASESSLTESIALQNHQLNMCIVLEQNLSRGLHIPPYLQPRIAKGVKTLVIHGQTADGTYPEFCIRAGGLPTNAMIRG